MADRGREIGDLGMAGQHTSREVEWALLPAGASTPLGGSSGELSRTYSGSSARVDYRRRLEMNTQDSHEDALFRQEMRYPEREGLVVSTVSGEPVQGRAGPLRLCNSWTCQDI
jgi:hypothetical protein